jgi:N-acyl amino acid synthase of PEP-CTERM/exosortase system
MHALHRVSEARPVDHSAKLSDHFHRHLEGEIAVNDSQRREAHQLRYEVYCTERGYEDSARFSDGLEKDEFDMYSVQSLVRSRSSGIAAGVVRLILPNSLRPDSLLPIEVNCGHSFNRAVLDDFEFKRTAIAEVSRFAVSSGLIAKAGAQAGNPSIQEEFSQYLPHIALGLIAMLFVTSVQHQITHWYAAMEPSLSRLLSRSGVDFTPIGPVVDYHGKRQPMIANVRDLLGNIYHKRHEFFQLIEHLGGVPSDFVGDMHSVQLYKPRQRAVYGGVSS